MTTADNIRIEPLTFTRVPEFYALFVTALESDFTYIDAPYRRAIARQNSPRHLVVAVVRRRRVIYYARQDGQLIGYVVAGLASNGIGTVDWLYVKPGIRGANIGLKLLTRAMRRLEALGAHEVTLVTYAYTGYYQRQGFRVIRRIMLDGVEQDLMRYRF